MNETAIQLIIQQLLEKNNTVPQTTSADYILRRGLMNASLEKWGGRAKEENIKWNSLYTTATFTTDGNAYTSLPAGFQEISSLVYIGGNQYGFKPNDEILLEQQSSSGDRFFWITGNPKVGYKLNFNPTPATGLTGNYCYYGTPTHYVAPTDISEVPKPYFIVYDTLSVLFEEERPDLSTKYSNLAKGVMESMIIDNELTPINNSTQIKNFGSLQGFTWGK